jgi:hypothetical protein
VLSFIFSILCPGLGAAYNGETVKAFVHFGLVAGLFQLAVQTGGMPIPVLGFLGLWFFILPMDAMLTAKVIKSGISQSEEEEILNGRFGGGRRFLGFILLAVGIIFLLTLILGPALISKGILPILLVILGIYATRDFMKTSRRLLSGTSRVPTERQQGSNAFRSGSWK